jgi:DNA-binding transcriptional MerR regulator
LPKPELHLTKHYSSIGEVAKLFNVSTSLLRYWEREFSQLKPKKSKQGIRKYSQADISKLRLIYDLVKKQGYTIRGAKEALNHPPRKLNKTPQDLIVALKDVKAFLVDLNQYIQKP